MKKIIVSILVIGMLLTTIPINTGGEEAVNREQSDTGESFDADEGALYEYVSDDGELIQYTSSDDSVNLPRYVPGELIVKFNDDVNVCLSGLTNGASATSATPEGSDGGMLTTDIESIDQSNAEYDVVSVEELFPDTTIHSLSNIYKFTFPVDTDIPQIMSDYNSDDNVKYAEPNYLFTTSYAQKRISKLVPNDPYFYEQWALHNTGQYELFLGFASVDYKYDADMDVPEAWNIETGDEDVVIAIIDTGVDYNHPDLADNIWRDPVYGNPGYDFVDIDTQYYIDNGFELCPDEDYTAPDGDPMDVMGHGTHCAGIAGAVTNNSKGIAGVSWNCKIMPVRNGFKIKYMSGTYGIMENDDSANAIIYAADNGADVISMSWGGYFKSQLIKDALNYAYSNDVILVAAAGNDNSNAKLYPASYDNVISVAATSPDDTKALFSNYGETVDVAAPGEFILSTVPTQMTGSHASFSDLFVESEKINSRPLYFSALGSANGEIVYVGSASLEDLEGIDLTGKIALIERHEKDWMLHSQVNNVYDKGADGAIFFNIEVGRFWTYIYGGSEIPAISIPRKDAQDIILMLEQGVVMSDLNVFKDAYQYYDGTSMAGPHVAGLAGLLISKNPQCPYPVQMVKSMLPFTVDVLQTDEEIGGRVNAFKLLNHKAFTAILDLTPVWEDVKGTIYIKGAAWGEDFQYFVLEEGLGEEPDSWTLLLSSSTPQGGMLLSLNTAQLDEGLHTIRLSVVCEHGEYTDEILIYVNNEADGTYDADIYVSNCFDSSTPGWGVTKFSGIQDGVDHAEYGERVFVYDGVYSEDVELKIKSIDLIGQNKDWAIIDGEVNISLTTQVLVKGFTFRKQMTLFASSLCEITENKFEITEMAYSFFDRVAGLIVFFSSFNTIDSNILKGFGYPSEDYGILLIGSSQNTISDNNLIDFRYSIYVALASEGNTISGNTLNGYNIKIPRTWGQQSNRGSYGIVLETSNNKISNNIIENHFVGISLFDSHFNKIIKNKITISGPKLHMVGIWVEVRSCFNKIIANEIKSDSGQSWGIWIINWGGEMSSWRSNYNKIYYNNFLNLYGMDGNGKNSTNIWYKEKLFGKSMGNYHFSYEEDIRKYFGEEPKDDEPPYGIWDRPYDLRPYGFPFGWPGSGEHNQDKYPVVNPIDIENIDIANLEMTEELTVEENEYLAQLEEMINDQIESAELNTSDFMDTYSSISSIITCGQTQGYSTPSGTQGSSSPTHR